MNQDRKIGSVDPLVIAAWCGTVFGLLEGVVMTFFRSYPRVRAPYKVSEDILWVAPLQSLVAYLLLAVVLTYLVKIGLQKVQGGLKLLLVFACYTMLGLLAATVSSGVIHWLAAIILAIGGGVSVFRAIRGREQEVTRRFRWGVIMIPAIIGLAWLGTELYRSQQESQMVQRLPVTEGTPPNVLVIVLDTVRYDSFAEDRQRGMTPNLDGLEAAGARYSQAWSTSSWSLPSQASIMTGLYPHEHGADWPGIELNGRCEKLAGFFAARGYVTGAFSSNAAWITSEHLGRGFLRFRDYTIENLLRRTFIGRLADKVLCRVGFHSAGRGKRASRVNRDLLNFLDDYPDRPFYAYVCYMDVNREFHNHLFNSRIGERQPRASTYLAYKSALTTLDEQVGQLMHELKQRDVLDNTIIVVTSDHGESFGTKVGSDHEPVGHGTSLYYEQTKVPLFVIYPGKVAANQVIDATVSIRQIPATIAHLLDDTETRFSGEPLPVEAGKEAEDSEAGQTTAEHPVLITLNYDKHVHRSVVSSRWQYITNPQAEAVKEELYDLHADPGSTTNLAPDHEMVPKMRKLLEGFTSAPHLALAPPAASSGKLRASLED